MKIVVSFRRAYCIPKTTYADSWLKVIFGTSLWKNEWVIGHIFITMLLSVHVPNFGPVLVNEMHITPSLKSGQIYFLTQKKRSILKRMQNNFPIFKNLCI